MSASDRTNAPATPVQIATGRFSDWFARQSTSAKMLLILTIALLPLGLIASLASIEAAQTNRTNRVLAAHLLAGDSAARLSRYFDTGTMILRDSARMGRSGCRRAAKALDVGDAAVRVAMFEGDGRLSCATGRFGATLPLRAAGTTPLVAIDPETEGVRLIAATDRGGWALAVLPRAILARAAHPDAVEGDYDLRLVDQTGQVALLSRMRTVMIGRKLDTRVPVAGGQLDLALTIESAPLSANELLVILLPLVMGACAAGIGWLVVDRLLLRPLAGLQRAIERSQQGAPLVVPATTTPAREIRELGTALTRANALIASHETDLEEGLARQTKLTREVHHRVKNNLQVVASLLNIHARGARSPEAAAAYGAIQRRVDALALVHRSHYAELEINRGVALRPLIGELVANLRASAPSPAPQATLEIAIASAHQDVAMPVAFLVTELFELSMLRAPRERIAITLALLPDAAERATLTVSSIGLSEAAAPVDEAFVRGLRVVEGLARQLRTSLHGDRQAGVLSIEIPVLVSVATSGSAESPDVAMQRRGGALAPRPSA